MKKIIITLALLTLVTEVQAGCPVVVKYFSVRCTLPANTLKASRGNGILRTENNYRADPRLGCVPGSNQTSGQLTMAAFNGQNLVFKKTFSVTGDPFSSDNWDILRGNNHEGTVVINPPSSSNQDYFQISSTRYGSNCTKILQ
jgi:hypothetical protein